MPRKAVAKTSPTITPDRALKALTQQLDALAKLKDRQYSEAEEEETDWEQHTQSIIEAAFGDPSSSMERFRGVGVGTFMATSPQLRQSNFESRIREYEGLLKALIGQLRLQLPEEEIKGVYESGEQYDFYRDLSSLIAAATREVFIVDAYLDEQVFNLYVAKVPPTATVRILSNKIGTNVDTVARMYAKSRPLELRSSADVHDRMLFIDQRGCVIGQSIKDAARKKPTYVIELEEPSLTAERDIHNKIWSPATSVI